MFNFGGGLLAKAVAAARGAGTPPTFKFGRVVDVVLDESSPYWDVYGRSQAINGIRYRPLDKAHSEDDDAFLPFAYCGNTNLISVPLKNEIVIITSLPSENRAANSLQTKNYWLSVVNIWNHPHHNAYPDTLQSGTGKADLGDDFEEVDTVAPLQTYPGDILISGRHGNTIRLGGTKQTYNTLTDESNNGKPFVIVKNKMKEPEDGTSLSTENINDDGSSIYMVSDHTVPLEEANTTANSWEEPADLASVYKGDQVLINGGRLFFNAKEEGAFIAANEYIGLASKEIHIDGDDMVSLDGKKIYLGRVAMMREDEPVILGTTLQDWLTNLTDNLNTLLKSLGKPSAPPAYVAANVATAKALQPALKTLKSQIKLLTSKKVFTE
jgi:hypothetical protein